MPPPTTTRGTFRKPGPFSLAVAGSFLGDVLILTRPPSNELSSEGGGARSNHCRVRDLSRWHSNKLSPAFIEGAKGLALGELGTVATIIRRYSKCVLRSGEFPRRRSRAVRQGCGGAIDVAAAMSSSRKLVKKEIDGANLTLPDDYEIGSGVSLRLARAVRHPPDPTAIAHLLRREIG